MADGSVPSLSSYSGRGAVGRAHGPLRSHLSRKVSPDAVTGAAVAPAALHLLEPVNATLLAPQAAPGPVNELHTRLRVDSKM